MKPKKLKIVKSTKTAKTNRWIVKSQTDGRRTYVVVRRSKGSFTCSCRGWIYSHKDCKHITQMKLRLAHREDL